MAEVIVRPLDHAALLCEQIKYLACALSGRLANVKLDDDPEAGENLTFISVIEEKAQALEEVIWSVIEARK